MTTMRTWIAAVLMLCAVPAFAQFPPPAYGRPSQVYFIEPARYLDTRIGPAPCQWDASGWGIPATGPFSDGETRTFMVANCWYANPDGIVTIPPTALGIILNITATNPTGNGYLVAYDALASRPPTSSLSFMAGMTHNSLAIVALGQCVGQDVGIPFWPDLALYVRVPGGGTMDVIVDVIGYVE